MEWLKQQFYDNPASQWAEKCRDVFTGWQKWQRLQKEHETLQETIKQWKRYCKDYTNNYGLSYYGCMFEIDGSCNCFPKDVYPTWEMYLAERMTADMRDGKTHNPQSVEEYMRQTRIPADIAQKLDIKPKEVK